MNILPIYRQCASSSQVHALPFPPPPAGQEPSDSVVDGMMSEAPGPLNFTMFLTLFGEKLTGQFRPLPFMVIVLCVVNPHNMPCVSMASHLGWHAWGWQRNPYCMLVLMCGSAAGNTFLVGCELVACWSLGTSLVLVTLSLLTCWSYCTGTDPEDVIRNAFACFDEEGTGKIHEDR